MRRKTSFSVLADGDTYSRWMQTLFAWIERTEVAVNRARIDKIALTRLLHTSVAYMTLQSTFVWNELVNFWRRTTKIND